MGKVKVTQKQADWLDRYKTDEEIDYAINIQPLRKRPDSPIADWKSIEVARALLNGYEVEPQFKVGDWVANPQGVIGQIEKIEHHFGDRKYLGKWYDIKVVKMDCYEDVIERHATPEEIEKEKQRRWWAKHGRDVWEIREDDTLIYAGTPYIVDWFNSEVVRFKSGKSKAGFTETFDYVQEHFEVFCFAEDRKDLNDSE